MAASNLTLVLPPLVIPDSDRDAFSAAFKKAEKPLTSLRQIFSRGKKESIDSQPIALAQAFTLPYSDPDTFPTAAIMAFGAGLDASTGYWLCAEPVYLHPDLDHVLLFDKSTFDLAKHELAQLVSEIDEMLLEDGITTHHGHQQSLFFRTADKIEAIFTPLKQVSGQNILQYLPEGEDASKWRMLQNEIQMQMTQSVVNKEREQRGLVSVNGLWFWGGGYLLRAKYKQVFDAVYANDLFTQGLAKITSTVAEKSLGDIDSINLDKNSIIVFDAIEDDPQAYIEFLLEVEKKWLKPAMQLIKKKQLGQLNLLTGNTRVAFTKHHQGQFWKRKIKSTYLLDAL